MMRCLVNYSVCNNACDGENDFCYVSYTAPIVINAAINEELKIEVIALIKVSSVLLKRFSLLYMRMMQMK